MWPFTKPKQPTPTDPETSGFSFFSTHTPVPAGSGKPRILARIAELLAPASRDAAAAGMDDSSSIMMGIKSASASYGYVPDALAGWYASQGFIGWQMCAIMAQHWLIHKACSIPGKDAVRNGWDIVSETGEDIDNATMQRLKVIDRRMCINKQLREFVEMGRVFGIRIAFFRVASSDPEYYEKPFNPDGIQPGAYKGIVQVDPYWCSPQLEGRDASQPDAPTFYEPTFWLINGKRYHRSHLIIYRASQMPDILKPQYMYGGIPIPQRIMERVYGAERTANEAPMLMQTKRTNVWLTDMSMFSAKGDAAMQQMQQWAAYRDNFGIKLGDKEGDQFQQFDTALGDVDNVTMTQYQLVAAAAEIPATKLLGTSPKGFGGEGRYEEQSYHETLRTLQETDLTPLLERHYLCVMRSEFGSDQMITAAWRPLDAPSAEEVAQTNLTKAQTGQALVMSGAISGEDEMRRVATDPNSGYAHLGVSAAPREDLDDGDPQA